MIFIRTRYPSCTVSAIDADREIAGFIAAQFAYGKIGLFMGFLERLFGLMKDGPVCFIKDGQWAVP